MDSGKLVFAQLMDFIPRHDFDACVRRYNGDHRLRGFSCRDQFLCLAFAPMDRSRKRARHRDVLACLPAQALPRGLRGHVSRSTLADANRAHDWRIFADFAQVLISQARKLYADEAFGVELEQTAYALDSTTIDLCLSLFPWARFRKRKGAVKLHTLVDLRGNIPCFVRITHGKTHDVTVLDHLPIEAGHVLRDGSRIHRFWTSSSVHDVIGILPDSCQAWPRLQPPVPSSGRQDDGIAERSDDRAGRPEDVASVPRPDASRRRTTTPSTTAGSSS